MTHLLTTKLFIPPLRQDIIPRPHLTTQLNTGLWQNSQFARKLTLISAPAGYGKTTLVSEWVGKSEILTTWLSLDQSDNNITRFLSYLIAALQGAHSEIGAEIQPILDSETHLPIEYLLTVLANDIVHSGKRFALVLDDYHVICEIKIHQAIDFLIDHIPPNLHLVIISRSDPPMPLGRLRVRREMVEIHEADLMFSEDEAATFLNDIMGLSISKDDIQKLEARTEGWIAGLQLAAITLQNHHDQHTLIRAFSGSHIHVIEYLVDEVMSLQSDDTRKFLLYTSILEQFNPQLCDALTQKSTGRQMLNLLEKENLFIHPLDDQRNWHRFHQLFKDFLRQRLSETQPGVIPKLYTRASQWYESQGMIDEAIGMAFTGENMEQAVRLLDVHAQTYAINGEMGKVVHWAEKLPLDLRSRYPRLCIFLAWSMQVEYGLEAIEPTLALAEAFVSTPNLLPDGMAVDHITSHACAVRAYAAFKNGDFDDAVRLSLTTLEITPEDGSDHEKIVRGGTTLNLGRAYLELGQLEPARQALEDAVELCLQYDLPYIALSCLPFLIQVEIAGGHLGQALANGEKGLLWLDEWSNTKKQRRLFARAASQLRLEIAKIQYEKNELDQASKNLTRATEHFELSQSWSRLQCYLLWVDINQAAGKIDKALDYLQRLKRISLMPGFSLPDIPFDAQLAERCLKLSQEQPSLDEIFKDVCSWMKNEGYRPDDDFKFQQEYEYYVVAQVLITQGKAWEATPLVDRLISSAETGARNGEMMKYLTLQAVAHHKEKSNQSLTFLSRALELGEPEGYIRSFVDFGKPVHSLLQLAAEQGIAPHEAYVPVLLVAFPKWVNLAVQKGIVETSGELLNERELQILRRIAAGLSDREIAEELYLSINTVKWYNRQIYSKLGVSRRGQAVARAQELGILN